MRRILIDDRIFGFATDYRDALQKVHTFIYTDKDGKTKKIYVKPLEKLNTLKAKINNGDVKEEFPDPADNKKKIYLSITDADKFVDYIDILIQRYPTDLLTMKPNLFESFNDDLIKKLKAPERLNAKLMVPGHKVTKTFHEIIVDTMQYTEVRKWILPEHIRKVGVKACVYCNANFTITSEEGHAFYDIDHWKPKAVYPWACLCFFNFQPACHTCNQLKNDDADDQYFGLYESNPNKSLDVLHFSLSSAGLTDFILNHNPRGLDIRLCAYIDADRSIADKQNSKLHINEIYKEHIDVIEEASWRKLIANDSWIKSIQEGLGSIGLDEKSVNRLIYANYTEADDMHKRPLSRLVQDILNMDFENLEVAKALRDSLLPKNIEVGDYFLLDDNSVVKIEKSHHDYFDCSDNDVHSIDELHVLEWQFIDFDNMPDDIVSKALSFSLDEKYGGNAPTHIVQNTIRRELGVEIQLNDKYLDQGGLTKRA